MSFSRRRWDAWCLGVCVASALAGAAESQLSGRFNPKVLWAFGIVALLWLRRFKIPVEGLELPTLRSLPALERRFYFWCAGSVIVITFAAFAAIVLRGGLWFVLGGSVIHFAVTLWLAFKVDRARLQHQKVACPLDVQPPPIRPGSAAPPPGHP